MKFIAPYSFLSILGLNIVYEVSGWFEFCDLCIPLYISYTAFVQFFVICFYYNFLLEMDSKYFQKSLSWNWRLSSLIFIFVQSSSSWTCRLQSDRARPMGDESDLIWCLFFGQYEIALSAHPRTNDQSNDQGGINKSHSTLKCVSMTIST